MYHFIPEITSKHLSVRQALDQFKTILPKNVTITFDNWFDVRNWIEFNKHLPITWPMKSQEKDGLLALFTHGLKKNQYRTFSNGKILITVFHDNG